MSAPSSLLFVSHACVAIRDGDALILTDPWYDTPAFTSWVPCPPPVVAKEIWPAIARTGKLAVVLSHLHPDHADVPFLRTLPPTTRIYVAPFAGHAAQARLQSLGFQNVIEIGDATTFRGIRLGYLLNHETPEFDSLITIETSDAFIVHGNDSWYLDGANEHRLRAMKPANKGSLFMGQGASASGHPLTYANWTPTERVEKLKAKNVAMLQSLSDLANRLGFDHALAYACFADIKVNGKDYGMKGWTSTGAYAQRVTGGRFIDLHPGDVYLPGRGEVVPVLRTLDVPLHHYETASVGRRFAVMDLETWVAEHDAEMVNFMDGMRDGISVAPGTRPRLVIEVVAGQGDSHVYHIDGDCPAVKVCCVPAGVMAAVLSREIPLEDLYTGYLAEWSRHPEGQYNREFLAAVMAYGDRYARAMVTPIVMGCL